jgi:hypothetical protein
MYHKISWSASDCCNAHTHSRLYSRVKPRSRVLACPWRGLFSREITKDESLGHMAYVIICLAFFGIFIFWLRPWHRVMNTKLVSSKQGPNLVEKFQNWGKAERERVRPGFKGEEKQKKIERRNTRSLKTCSEPQARYLYLGVVVIAPGCVHAKKKKPPVAFLNRLLTSRRAQPFQKENEGGSE